MCVRALHQDFGAFTSFVRSARWDDGGQRSLEQAYGRRLEGLIEQFFGAGDWAPVPERWSS